MEVKIGQVFKKYRNECKGWEYIEIQSYVFSQRKERDQFCGNTATNHRSIEEKYSSKRRLLPTSQFLFNIFSNLIVTTHNIINIVCVISAAEDPQGKQAVCPRVCLDISCVIINRLDSVGLNGIWYNQNDELLYNHDMIVMM